MPIGSCPNGNGIELGGRTVPCVCPEHHPGLTEHMPQAAVVRLSIVTPGAPAQRATEQERFEMVLAQARAVCPACRGDADVCRDGTGEPHFARLKGCAAFTGSGSVKPLAAKPAPRQPWDIRRSRTRAA